MDEKCLALDLHLKPTNDPAIGELSALPVTQVLYRLDLAYNGASYQGFQSQPSGMAIQDHLEKALAIFCRHPVRVTSSSRTDAGVHAEDQVVTFKSVTGIELYRIVKSLNALLPADIRIKRASVASENFHPIFNSTGKVYRYRIWRSAGENPMITPYTWTVTAELALAEMEKATRAFIGTHDFTSFCAVDSSARSKIRNVREIIILDRGPLLEVWIVGDGFLKQMVRNIVGALVAVGRGKLQAVEIKRILEGLNRELAPATAPANGLCLVRVFYGDDLNIGTLLEQARNGYNISLAGDWI